MACCGKSAAIRIDRPQSKPLIPIKVKPVQKLRVNTPTVAYNDRERHRV